MSMFHQAMEKTEVASVTGTSSRNLRSGISCTGSEAKHISEDRCGFNTCAAKFNNNNDNISENNNDCISNRKNSSCAIIAGSGAISCSKINNSCMAGNSVHNSNNNSNINNQNNNNSSSNSNQGINSYSTMNLLTSNSDVPVTDCAVAAAAASRHDTNSGGCGGNGGSSGNAVSAAAAVAVAVGCDGSNKFGVFHDKSLPPPPPHHHSIAPHQGGHVFDSSVSCFETDNVPPSPTSSSGSYGSDKESLTPDLFKSASVSASGYTNLGQDHLQQHQRQTQQHQQQHDLQQQQHLHQHSNNTSIAVPSQQLSLHELQQQQPQQLNPLDQHLQQQRQHHLLQSQQQQHHLSGNIGDNNSLFGSCER